MHPRNPHKNRYDLRSLAKATPELAPFIAINKYGNESIDFADNRAVKALNKAILRSFYQIDHWDIPENYLCPAVPGRADYIHTVADLFADKKNLRVLDIGTGANCIYPLIGVHEYHWQFVASDVDSKALANAQEIVEKNSLEDSIETRLQKSPEKIFESIIDPLEKFDLTICNPPFHESETQARQGTQRKLKNLGKTKSSPLNFGGQSSELWCPGGEKAFIQRMVQESLQFGAQVKWFTTLVSKEENLPFLLKTLRQVAAEARILDMELGNKKSRALSWRIHTGSKA